ncbi:MAG: aminopeptidase [Coriobacteriales bacterium]|jgi:aminopeptidase|nr:aminopeptidase [Coriobacteriales bacterium]
MSTDEPSTELTLQLERYAHLVVSSGVALQPGQDLYISISTDCLPFARILTAEAYRAGARRVTVRLADEAITRLTYDNCPVEVFEVFPEWLALMNNSIARDGAAILIVDSGDPKALTGVDPMKLVANTRAAHVACKEFYDAQDSGRLVWCIIGAASPAWARHVFSDLPADEALARLWQAIFATIRLNTPDPIEAWRQHQQSFTRRIAWLAEQGFDRLHYRNALGTDLTIGLNTAGIWKGGGDALIPSGRWYFPNMPTEEIFTSPDRLRTNGVVYASMPLVHNGSIIEGFSLTFADGRVTDCAAEKGLEVLRSIIATDEGAAHLGEVALVPWTSPIRESGLLFFSTLYDENASCHLALGTGFPDCLEGGTEMSEEEYTAAGVNKSATHVDFMVGTADLEILGIRADGTERAIFSKGEWAF